MVKITDVGVLNIIVLITTLIILGYLITKLIILNQTIDLGILMMK